MVRRVLNHHLQVDAGGGGGERCTLGVGVLVLLRTPFKLFLEYKTGFDSKRTVLPSYR